MFCVASGVTVSPCTILFKVRFTSYSVIGTPFTVARIFHWESFSVFGFASFFPVQEKREAIRKRRSTVHRSFSKSLPPHSSSFFHPGPGERRAALACRPSSGFEPAASRHFYRSAEPAISGRLCRIPLHRRSKEPTASDHRSGLSCEP